MKKIIFLIMLVLCASFVLASDLSNIEDTFVKDGKITASVVVADKGTSSQVLAQLDIINYLGKSTTGSLQGIGKLTSEVSNIYSTDIISIGNPCLNTITKDIMGYTGDCTFTDGLIKLYNKNNKNQLVIYSPSDASIRDIVRSLTTNKYSGTEVIIEPTKEEIEAKKTEELLKKIQEQKEEEPVVEVQEEPVVTPQPAPEIPQTPEPEATKEPQKKNVFVKIFDWFKGLFS
ncbi:MAG: hypothetical protein KJ601_03325 [Nanoarchaeota archaeon]|nr:hypothetical protein [Nanoarchaeota archaeon]MBU1704866.1 hypothetical protein [Nanoarchaeota archaeon]